MFLAFKNGEDFFIPKFLLVLNQFFYTKVFVFFYFFAFLTTKFWNLEKDFFEKNWCIKKQKNGVKKTKN